jgi:hypothetical protein
VGTCFGGCGITSAVFVYRVLNSPCYETPQNAIKKNEQRAKQPWEKKKRSKKGHIFCDEQMDFFEKQRAFFRVFEPTLIRNAQKHDKTNQEKIITNSKSKKVSNYFLFWAAANVCFRTSPSSLCLSRPPLGRPPRALGWRFLATGELDGCHTVSTRAVSAVVTAVLVRVGLLLGGFWGCARWSAFGGFLGIDICFWGCSSSRALLSMARDFFNCTFYT